MDTRENSNSRQRGVKSQVVTEDSRGVGTERRVETVASKRSTDKISVPEQSSVFVYGGLHHENLRLDFFGAPERP